MDTTKLVSIDEEVAYKHLLRKLKGKSYSRVVTCGRAGLGAAQRVAYLLGVPVKVLDKRNLILLREDTLFVDDIVCTGDTISCIPRSVDVATLVHRKSALYKPTFTGLVFEGDEYIKFSWES